jgi:transposase
MAKELLSDELWAVLDPLIPPPPRARKGGGSECPTVPR